MSGEWNHKVFGVDAGSFEQTALDIFRFQAAQNEVYRSYLEALHIDPSAIHSLVKIPFLPIRFFRSGRVMTTLFEPAAIFESSGTTGSDCSRHYIKDLRLYETGFLRCFELFYGPVKEWCIIGLLPSYLERSNSSLVYMVQRLVQASGHPKSGFYLDEFGQLAAVLEQLEKAKQKTLLLGVTFALLDFAQAYPQQLKHTIVMETGGMKGRKRELVREEVHAQLRSAFGIPEVHAEYGMTELLSQAYATKKGLFTCPPWMRVLIRDEEDPFSIKEEGTGAINVIDLANTWSCSFIATDDAGRLHANGTFEVLGRLDGSDLRGCSLLTV